ncbi:choline dehydrogenase [Antricoccus suffuscus]|uniref:Choline dehydrogenase n=1 Tax=Antricoccus suffuscus TaxID=1629062 RepID=A0A2T1A336_9ACTN|nr:GMC family oxidoreductase [Antricoccus suffuscus]PRZ43013.1 choline dehydrogenase [Antricoccus suffuscus]
MSDRLDTIIVGGGTAGCVLAARLAENRTVLLLEAGPDQQGGRSIGGDLADDRSQGLEEIAVSGSSVPYLRGKILGGCSAVNDGGLWRAPSADFAAWSGQGLPSWSWERVLAAYQALECDRDFGDEDWHGDSGPMPVSRTTRLEPPAQAMRTALSGFGAEWVPDMNAPTAVGVGPYPKNIRDGKVVSTATSHLAPARFRAGLEVRTETPVERLTVRNGRVTGVKGNGYELTADQVVLCAGAIGTPAILLRSGVGARDVLADAGVDLAVEVPGVGQGICDQPGAVLPAMPTPGVIDEHAERSQLVARLPLGPQQDASLYMCLFVGPPPTGGPPMLALMVGDLAPLSRGSVRVDRRGHPRVDLALLTELGDRARIRTAYRRAWEVLHHEAFSTMIDEVMMADQATIDNDSALDRLLGAQVFSRLATLGGARMGVDPNLGAVVDDRLHVYGVSGLYVADLSIVPVPLRAPSAAEAMMIGERAAEILR